MSNWLQTNSDEVYVPNDSEYIALVKDILTSENVRSMVSYIQHGNTSCLAHSINVSYLSFLYCKRHGLNFVAAARAGLLHDLFLYDWHTRPRQKGELLHGFEHPRKALENASSEFELSGREKDIILRHMWPLTLTPPRYSEGYVVVFYDKYCSVRESLFMPVIETKFDSLKLCEIL